MAKKRPKINLAQPIQPQTGDLEKLFATAGDVEQASGLQLLAIRIEAILPDPYQPRRTFPEESLAELSSSIRQDGVIQPIEVTQTGPDQYMIVHGERRWRAAQMAGLQTIPAVVQRRNYDEVTRFVRQLVENIQREDLNDVDRAAGLLRLRDLLQEELEAAKSESISADEPWASKMTWAKVGKRLGYTRQRIHQLIQLLKLPDEIKEAVREGSLSERDTRIYQGLRVSQQRALHEMRMSGDLSPVEAAKVARYLKAAPEQTVHQAVRDLRRLPEPMTEPEFNDLSNFDDSAAAHNKAAVTPGDRQESLRSAAGWTEGTIRPLRNNQPTGIDRLHWIRSHLSRIQRHGLSASERQETLRLLRLVQQDVASLIAALESDESG